LLDQRWPIARTGQEVVVEGIIASLPERSAAAADSSDHDKPADDAVAATDDEAPAAPALFTWRFLFEPDAAARA
jgi:hypothetical protein